MSASPFVWIITGCSGDIGRELVTVALNRGDKVIATTRAESFEAIKNLTSLGADILVLDVTSSPDELKKTAAEAIAIYGHVDVLMNNAGIFMLGSYEETIHEETLAQFNTNVFGALNVSRAFLPYMRQRRSGTIAFTGTCWAWKGVAFAGLYVASRYALRGIAESLHQEIAPFGMRSICFDFGFTRTTVIDKSKPLQVEIPDYKAAGGALRDMIKSANGTSRGDPAKGAEVVVSVIKGDGRANGKKTPINGFAVGVDTYEIVKKSCEDTLERLEEWKELSLSTDFPESSA